jgi:hypothetical protein
MSANSATPLLMNIACQVGCLINGIALQLSGRQLQKQIKIYTANFTYRAVSIFNAECNLNAETNLP